jgi:hypothetical protein
MGLWLLTDRQTDTGVDRMSGGGEEVMSHLTLSANIARDAILIMSLAQQGLSAQHR